MMIWRQLLYKICITSTTLIFLFTAGCNAVPELFATPTPTVTSTPTITPTLTLTPTPTDTPTPTFTSTPNFSSIALTMSPLV